MEDRTMNTTTDRGAWQAERRERLDAMTAHNRLMRKAVSNDWNGGDYIGPLGGTARWTRGPGGKRVVLALTVAGVLRWQVEIADGVPEELFAAAFAAAVKAVR
jgi:hypothetical protein